MAATLQTLPTQGNHAQRCRRRRGGHVGSASDGLPIVTRPSLTLFLLGLAFIGLGISVMQVQNRVRFFPGFLQALLAPYVNNCQDVFTGMALLIVGLLLAGVAARHGPLRIDLKPYLPVPTFQRDTFAVASAVLASLAATVLFWRLGHHRHSAWDASLLLLALSLFAFVVHRLDRTPQRPILRLTRWDWIVAFSLATCSGLLNSIDLTKWTFAFVGDEISFFDAARDYANGAALDVFNLSKVYDTHPALDSIIQGLLMRLTGQVNVWGWRFSEVLVLSFTVILVYLIGLTLFGRTTALVAGALIGCSHYLMAFTRIAYNNTHMLFYSTLLMLMLALAWRTQRLVFVFLTGLAAGLCLYTFQGAMVVWLPLTLLLLINFLKKPSWAQAIAHALMLAAFLLTVAPGLLTTPLGHVIHVAIENSHREAAAVHPWLVARMGTVRSLLFWWVNHQWFHHYVGGPGVDRVTGMFFAAGIGIALFRLRRLAERTVLVWFLSGLLAIAATNYLPEPSITRLLFLMPPIALLAANSVATLETMLQGMVTLPTKVSRFAILSPLLAVVICLNADQLFVISPTHVAATPQTMAMKAVQEHPRYTVVEVGRVPDQTMAELFSLYPWLSSRYRFLAVSQLDTLRKEGSAVHPPIVLVSQGNQDLVRQIAAELPPHYKLVTDRDPARTVSTSLFLPDLRARPH